MLCAICSRIKGCIQFTVVASCVRATCVTSKMSSVSSNGKLMSVTPSRKLVSVSLNSSSESVESSLTAVMPVKSPVFCASLSVQTGSTGWEFEVPDS